MATRILFIGADALDGDTVQAWAEDGTLPTFRRLLREGAWGVTENPPGLYVGAVWPSFWTSVGPDRHGRYCYEQLRPGSYETVRIHPTDTRAPAFWNALGAAGKRVAVIDIPKTHVVEGLNGIHVVDWGTHDPDFEGPVTWPAPLAADLVAQYGRDAVGNCNAHGTAGDYEKLRGQLVARIARRTRMLRDIMARDDWDAVIAAFSESHCVGHQCWHLHDAAHVRHDAALAARIGDPVRDVYVAIDAAIGELIEAAGPGTDVIVLGSHGMRAHYDASFMLDAILRRIERPGHGGPRANDGVARQAPVEAHTHGIAPAARAAQGTGTAAPGYRSARGAPLLCGSQQRCLRRHPHQSCRPRATGSRTARR